ncbi:hypothetical protein Bca101_056229 [Brassica carinata]
MDNDLASDGGINVDNDVLGCGEIEMKSDRTIVKPPLSDWPVFTRLGFGQEMATPQCLVDSIGQTHKFKLKDKIITTTRVVCPAVPPPLNPTLDIPIAASDVPDKLITENDVSYLAQLTEIKPVFYDESSSLTKDEESESETKRPGRCA